MKSFSRENAIFLMALAAAFTAAAVNLAFVSGSRGIADGKPVGSVSQRINTVEQRSVGNPIWNRLEARSPVYDRDTVRTGPSSSATINLGDGLVIALGEQSMVFIDVSREKTRLRVSGGAVSVSSSRKTSPILLDTRAGTVEIQEGNVQLRDSVDGMKVELHDGEVSVNAGGDTVTLNEPSILDADTAEVLPLSVELGKPEQGAYVPIVSPADKVSFSWTGSDDGDFRIMVARDASFERVEIDERARGGRFEANLPEGLHYWKIADSSSVQWFTVARATPPRPIAPIGAAYTYFDTLPVIPFIWSEVANSGEYRLEVYSSQGGDNPVLVKSVNSGKTSVDTLGAGTYFWRVVAISGESRLEAPSSRSTFTIATAPFAIPVVRAEAPILGRYALMRGAPAVLWGAVAGATGYEAVVARNAQGSDVERRAVTSVTALKLEDPPPVGAYYVRVRSLAGKGASEFSAPTRITIAESRPLVPLSPVREVSMSSGDGVIEFSWADPNAGDRYQFLLSAKESLEDPLANETLAKRSHSVAVGESIAGTLYWKVSLLGSDGSTIATTGAQSVRVIRRLGRAVPLAPIKGERVDINDSSVIRFSWVPVDKAEGYEIDLYRVTAGLSSKVRSWRTTESAIAVALADFDGLVLADYSWTVIAVGLSGGEYAPSLPVTSYFKITQSSTLPAPRINLMKAGGGKFP